MNLRSLLVTAGFLLLIIAGANAQIESYDDVMLIINDASVSSKEIGNYFATRRNIPQRNVLHINVDTSETMDSARFVALQWQIQGWMRQNGLVDAINYIVTTKGCPLRIATAQWDKFDSLGRLVALGGQASFEDCLALINGADSTLILSVKKQAFPGSRYFNSTRRFRRNSTSLPMYLVTRLDAYTVEQVKSYIQRAENPSFIDEGLWVLDVDPGKDGNPGYQIGNDWLRDADTVLRDRGMNVLFNNDTNYIYDQRNVLGYGSWGSNDGHSGGGAGARPRNTWLNASIAETFVSTGGRSFMPGTGYGQSLIADWIAEGVCGIKGYTDEPYLTSIAHPDIVFDRYTAGYNMAESFYAGSLYAAWRQVVIGDPKMRLRPLLNPSKSSLAMIGVPRNGIRRDTIIFTNALDTRLEVLGMALTGTTTGYAVQPLDGPLDRVMQPGESMRVVVEFAPKSYGTTTPQLEIRNRREGTTREIKSFIDITGEAVRPMLEYPTTFDFGPTVRGQGATKTITVKNLSPADTIEVTSISLSGVGASSFTASPVGTVRLKIPADSTLTITLTYMPSAATRDSVQLRLLSNAEGLAQRITVYGNGTTSGVESPEVSEAGASLIVSASPNPFTTDAEVRYVVPEEGAHVRVELLDLLGRPAATLVEGMRAGGEHVTALDGDGLAEGAYLCRVSVTLRDGSTHASTRMMLHQK